MKLSEAMMLGSVTCKMESANFDSCALGAAANAVGLPEAELCISGCRLIPIKEYWPWLRELSRGKEGHSDDYVSMHGGESDWAQQIFYRFDRSVVWGRSMTLEELVDYVRSIEPECGECNRFYCSCKKADAPSDSTVAVLA
jgi:hypothetical protein